MSNFKYFSTKSEAEGWEVNYPFYGYINETDLHLFPLNGATGYVLDGVVGCPTITYYSETEIVPTDSCVSSYNYEDGIGLWVLNSLYIPPSLFPEQNSITKIILSHISSIEGGAFRYCSSLESITIPNSVANIGDNAFYECTSLTSPVYNAHCFAYMPKSYNGAYTIPDGIKQIAGCAFITCSSLTSITIPNSVQSIGGAAFFGCHKLASVTIGSGVTRIEYEAFQACYQLTSVTIPDSVAGMGHRVFSSCPSLTSMAVEPGNTTYDSRDNCNAIIETTTNTLIAGCQNTIIPNSVTRIGDNAFLGCESLTSVTIPNSVTSIGQEAFSNCYSLTVVDIPNSVTNIEHYAFTSCTTLTSATIGSSVTRIGYGAFSYCESLTSITCGAVIPPTLDSNDTFSDVKAIYVPAESVEAYKQATNWSYYADIIQPIPNEE